jgi:hypothetical protein
MYVHELTYHLLFLDELNYAQFSYSEIAKPENSARLKGRGCGGPSKSRLLGACRPPSAQPLAMPAHDPIGLDEHQGVAPVPPRLQQYDPEESVARAQLWTSDGALQGSQLLPKRQVLKGDGPVAAADQSNGWEEDDDRRQHAILSRIKRSIQPAGSRSHCGGGSGGRWSVDPSG